jgi:hypothetical protein
LDKRDHDADHGAEQTQERPAGNRNRQHHHQPVEPLHFLDHAGVQRGADCRDRRGREHRGIRAPFCAKR